MPMYNFSKRSDGRYMFRLYLGKDDNGRKKYKTLYGKTKKELQKKCEQARISLNKGIDLMAQNDTFERWCNEYIRMKKAKVSPRYIKNVESLVKHLSPLFPLEIAKIKPIQVQNILLDLANRTEHPLAKKTLRDVQNTANGVFKLAISNRVMDFNPAYSLETPEGTGKKKREPITAEQINWIIESEESVKKTAAMIMLFAGLRRGELIALTWPDINLEEKTILVNKTAQFYNNTPSIKPTTKTKAGMRLISIPDVLVEYLKTIKRTSLLVCSKNGKMLTEGAFRRMWESYMKILNEKYGDFVGDENCRKRDGTLKSRIAPGGLPLRIKTFTPHQLRHTYASMLYKAGIDVVTAKELMGHSDIKTTLGIYTHLDSLYKKKSVGKLNSFIRESNDLDSTENQVV